jgi:hypothetical protein
MSIQMSTAQFDLGMTAIENLFLEEFMPYAEGLDIKVYLLGLKLLMEEKGPTLERIASRLSVDPMDVLTSFRYWESQGIVKIIDDDTDPDIFYLSIRNVYLESNFSRKTLPTSLEANPYLIDVFREVDHSLAVALSESERQQLIPFLQAHPVSPEVVAMAFEEARRNRYRAKKALEHLRYWVEHGVEDLEGVLELKQRLNLRAMQYKEVLRSLGKPYDQPTAGDKKSIDTWLDEYNFSLEDILTKLTEITLRKRNPSMAYLNAVFKNQFEGTDKAEPTDSGLDELFRKRR